MSATSFTNQNYLGQDFDFDHDFKTTLTSVEQASKAGVKAAKQMRTFKESAKSKKTVASLIEQPAATNTSIVSAALEHLKTDMALPLSKQLKQPEKPFKGKSQQMSPKSTTLTNESIMENRKKLREKMATKKTSPDVKSKAGKKPRVWDLGGNAKDAVSLDRSHGVPPSKAMDTGEDLQLPPGVLQNDVILKIFQFKMFQFNKVFNYGS